MGWVMMSEPELNSIEVLSPVFQGRLTVVSAANVMNLRRECFGELIQIDGSDRCWFEDCGDPCILLVFIDYAASTLMEFRFMKSECTFSYFEALESYLHTHGRPVAFYGDKNTVFRVARRIQDDPWFSSEITLSLPSSAICRSSYDLPVIPIRNRSTPSSK